VGHRFFLEPSREGIFILMILGVGPCLFYKLAKGGPGELQCMLMGIPPVHPPIKK